MTSQSASSITEVVPSGRTRSQARTTLLSGTFGALIEWYDYTVYATASALVFGALFFPGASATVGQLEALASFGVGFLARPLGAWVAGHLGDRLGRKRTLILTFSIMTASTALIGLLPAYRTIGVAAPILLCVFRLTQGFAVGGEWGGASTIAVENAPAPRRGLFGSWPQIGVSTGLLVGTGVVYLSERLSGDGFQTWGWRLPFLLAVPLAVVGFYIRYRALESPAFVDELKQREASRARESLPIVQAFRDSWRSIVIAFMAGVGQAGSYYIFTVFILSYATNTVHSPESYGLSAVMIGSALNIVLMPAFGALSDRIGRKAVLVYGGAALVVLTWPLLTAIETGSLGGIVAGVAVFLALIHPALYAPLPAMYCELFPTRSRYTGISISYQLGSMSLGGFGPFIASALVAAFGGTWPLVLFMAACGVVTVVGALLSRDRRHVALADIEP